MTTRGERWQTALTSNAQDKILVRGYALDEMMGRLTFAEAVYLLLMGELPTPSIGRMLNLTDAATNQPYTRNPYLNPQNGELFTGPSSMVAAVQAVGARVILCNNAFGFWTMLIGRASNQEPAAVRTEMLGHLAAGVTIVPAMVQAIEQAQRADLTYMKNS